VSALKVMGRNVKRLVGLIDEMIEFSRMEIRGIQLKVTLFDVGKLVRESVASAQPQALAKDLSVSIFVADGFPPVWADREKIGQVLGILLSNAVKFSHQGGMIQVRVLELPPRTLAIAVSDTGIGIDPLYHQRIFDKFFQVDGSMTRRYEGTGIGLSIAKSIVEAHDGSIELESEPNKGSTFTMLLPNATFDSTVSTPGAEALENLRVLVVAEDNTFRRTFRGLLSRCGCLVEEAKNGYECIRLAQETEPDVILVDEIFSDVAAPATITTLRQNVVAERIPIIAVMGGNLSKLRATAEVPERVHFMAKPFSAQELILRIREICLGEEPVVAVAGRLDANRKEPRVLVVDPDEDLRGWVEAALTHRNIPCTCAPGVGLAAECFQNGELPGVVFTDIDVPGSNAGGTVAALREALALQEVPICVMSGLLPADGRLPEGAAAALKKPFSIQDLIRVIEELRPASVV
jgi:CheY-like chemotaxis protein/anti-sigma regulatory factor (Ser/Thr protein kinase)